MWSKKIKYLIKRKKNRPKIAVLVDPDKFNQEVIILSEQLFVDFFFVGGSYLYYSNVPSTIRKMRKYTSKPIILFPGDEKQLSPLADGVLFLSLVSGRNPEYLIEKQIKAAPFIQKHHIPFLPTAYILVDGSNTSATEKVTHTNALPQNKNIIYKTALAAAMLGMQAIYLEAGSGAKKVIRPNIVHYIKTHIDLPLIVGGGISSVQQIEQYTHTQVDCLVIGNALEKNPLFLNDIKNYFQWK